MTMVQQTAVEWLVEQLPLSTTSNGEFIVMIPQSTYHTFVMKAKQMEKEQILNAFTNGDYQAFESEAEQYYNETYGK